MKITLKKLTSKGDTIVEVLLAIVVVSGTLGTAFATIDRGVQGTRASQERAEALKLVESQVELLKVAHEQGVSGLFGRTDGFCLESSGGSVAVHEAFNPSAAVGDLSTQDISSYSDVCSQGEITGGYNLSIQEDDRTNNPGVFTVRARWDNVGGDHRDQIEIKYKLQES